MKSVRQLSPHEIESLTRFVDADLRGKEIEDASVFLRSVRTAGQWLGCSCRKPMPVLHVVLMDTGRLVLRNNRDGAHHQDKCPFSHENTANKNREASAGRKMHAIDSSSHIALHAEFSRGNGANSPQISSRSAPGTGGSDKKLLSMLMTLMDASGLCLFTPGQEHSLSDQFAALRESAKRFTLAPGLPLDGYLDTRINKQRLVSMSMKLRKAIEFRDHRRIGLLVDQVAGVSGREIQLADGSAMGFFGKFERNDQINSPSLAMCTVTAQGAGTSYFEIGNVAAVPVLSKLTMFPVSDEDDRTAVADVFGLLDWLLKKCGVTVSALRRPLSDEPWLLELRSRKLIVRVDLASACVLGRAPSPLTSPETLSLQDAGSIEALKKKISFRFKDKS